MDISLYCTVNTHPSDVRLSFLENAYSHPLFSAHDFDPAVGQTGLVFGVRSRFISGSVHARLHIVAAVHKDL